MTENIFISHSSLIVLLLFAPGTFSFHIFLRLFSARAQSAAFKFIIGFKEHNIIVKLNVYRKELGALLIRLLCIESVEFNVNPSLVNDAVVFILVSVLNPVRVHSYNLISTFIQSLLLYYS